MNDQYRISETPAAGGRRGVLRPVLWLAVVLSAAGNVAASTLAGKPLVGSAFGLVALVCATALVVNHYRNRAR